MKRQGRRANSRGPKQIGFYAPNTTKTFKRPLLNKIFGSPRLGWGLGEKSALTSLSAALQNGVYNFEGVESRQTLFINTSSYKINSKYMKGLLLQDDRSQEI